MVKFIFVAGPPGSGKNTQAKLIREELGYAYLDIGDMVRRLIESGELKHGEDLEKGLLMPMERVLFLSKREVRKILDSGANGLVISGMPRSQEQAFGIGEEEGIISWLTREYGKDEIIVFHIDIPEGESVRRNLARREGRKDDNQESLKVRLREYKKETVPTFPDMKEKGYEVIDIDGAPKPAEVFKKIQKYIK